METHEASADPERAFWLLSDETRIVVVEKLT